MRKDVAEWIRFSKSDLDSAQYLRAMHPLPVEIICCHCQQSAEKALKAFLLSGKQEIKKTHDLRFLLGECLTLDADFQHIADACSRVTVHGAQSRYPFSVEINEDDMALALSDAEKIFRFVSEKLQETANAP